MGQSQTMVFFGFKIKYLRKLESDLGILGSVGKWVDKNDKNIGFKPLAVKRLFVWGIFIFSE